MESFDLNLFYKEQLEKESESFEKLRNPDYQKIKDDLISVENRCNLNDAEQKQLESSLEKLHLRMLHGDTFKSEDMGNLDFISLGLIMINLIIQRDFVKSHCFKDLISKFNPVGVNAVKLIYYPEENIYTCYDGQHTLCTLYYLLINGFFEGFDENNWHEFKVKADWLNYDATNAVSISKGEALANNCFVLLNGKSARLPVSEFGLLKAEYNSAARYGSVDLIDKHSESMWKTFLDFDMKFVDKVPGGRKARNRGEIVTINNLKDLLGHGTENFRSKEMRKVAEILGKSEINRSAYGIDTTFILALTIISIAVHDEYLENEFDWTGFTDYMALFSDTRNPGYDTVPFHNHRNNSFGNYIKKRWDFNRYRAGSLENISSGSWKDKIAAMFLIRDYINQTDATVYPKIDREQSEVIYKAKDIS